MPRFRAEPRASCSSHQLQLSHCQSWMGFMESELKGLLLASSKSVAIAEASQEPNLTALAPICSSFLTPVKGEQRTQQAGGSSAAEVSLLVPVVSTGQTRRTEDICYENKKHKEVVQRCYNG